jgi:hypothetical protein
MKGKPKSLSSAGLSVETKVVADFDVGETPVGRVLGRTFPSSGRLTLKALQPCEVNEILHHPGQDNSPVVVNRGQTLVDVLKQHPSLPQRCGALHGQLGLIIVVDGRSKFLMFKSNKPNNIPKPRKSLFPGGIFKYTFKTSLDCDNSCSHLLDSEQDLIDCVNLLLMDGQLGHKHRCLRNGHLELLNDSKLLSHRQQLRRAFSNAFDPVRTILSVAAEATSAFPPASAAIKGVLAAHTVIIQTPQDHQREAEVELERARKLPGQAARLLTGTVVQERETMEHKVGSLTTNYHNLKPLLEPISDSTRISRIFRLNRNKDTIQESRRALDAAERDFADMKDSYLFALNRESMMVVAGMAQNVADLQHRVSRLSIMFSVACF